MTTKKPKNLVKSDRFVCEFCKKDFAKEQTLMNHICEQKRRYLQRDQRSVKLGFIAFQEFYKLRMNASKPTYESFAKSDLYTAFVRFGRYLIDINAINTSSFINYLVKSDVPIADWESVGVYQKYVRLLTLNESPTDALERNFKLMQQWAVLESENWIDFFRKVSPGQAVLWIETGRISPWIWFLTPSAPMLLERMSPEQQAVVELSFDEAFWRHKMKLYEDEVRMIQQELEAVGI